MKKKPNTTNDFPQGKFLEDDEGALQLGITVQDKTIVVAFGNPIAWLGMDYHTAVEFANTILKRAEEIKSKEERYIFAKPAPFTQDKEGEE